MTEIQGTGVTEMRLLSARLRQAGSEGRGLRRNLYKQMNEAVKPLAGDIGDVEHLRPYMPDRYAAVLAGDLGVGITRSFSADPRIEVRAKGRRSRRKLARLDAGLISHPVYARGPRQAWNWAVTQTAGMRPGFFTEAVRDASPQIRDKILQAMTETAREITGKQGVRG
jgi:hypothetical protein